ncbi:uncharacterized protein LOC112905410 [Agrilus planipennis]|uniref:Uncharacterized protein LOC112904075 n=1 Tax=Agrilus planipennis TaxID=224129 RepID=A0A7F5R283_AGRPL|nr:uncharacterized protein LOC112904075 [Agrilus planipennis]XP_025833560.1 uncharacterized protein LOC112905410 [Agrilus planipennis]
MFKFGVKSIEKREDEVMVKLLYTPRAHTMLKKLGNLPIAYLRLAVEDDCELHILRNLYQRYTFNLKDDEGESLQMVKDSTEGRLMISDGRETEKIVMQQQQQQPPQQTSISEKRKVNFVFPNNEEKCNKKKLLESRMNKPCSTMTQKQPQSPPNELVEVYDDDAFDFNSQKYSLQEL